MKQRSRTFIFSTLLLLVLYLVFVWQYDSFILQSEQQNLDEIALVISSAVWNIDPEGIRAYLNLACKSRYYSYLKVMDENKIFIELEHKITQLGSKLFSSLGLIPRHSLSSEIFYNNNILGSISVTWYNMTIYLYINILVVLILFLIILWFQLGTISVKNKLEKNVLERTRDLQNEINERKLIENALRQSEEKYRSLFNSLPDVFYRSDLDGKLVVVSPSFTDILGYSIEEAIGMHVASQIYVDPNLCQTFLKKLNEKGFIRGFEAQLRRKDGHIIWCAANSRLFRDEHGEVAGVEGIFRDISEQRRTDEEKKELQIRLQRAEKMEALGMLAGGIAHDLNNLLTGLVTLPDVLLSENGEQDHLQSNLRIIKNSGQQASAIVQDLLTLARRGVTVSKITNLNHIIKHFESSAEYNNLVTQYKTIKVHFDLAPDLHNISGSPFHLQKTLTNLVSNAFESILGNGVVHISTKNRYLDKPIPGYDNIQEGNYAVICVSDTGSGIFPGDLKKIFEPFYTRKAMGRSGTGLGMAVVWGTVKDHHGYIDVQSTVGTGTCFTLYFPVIEKSSDTNKPKSLKELYGKGELILVVDDLPQQRHIAALILEKLGYQVETVSSGEEAIEYLQKQPVDLLVLDMIMTPGMNGLETYKKVYELNQKQKTIIVSGYSDRSLVKEAQILGAGEYVLKPYTLETLGLAVRSELSRNMDILGGKNNNE